MSDASRDRTLIYKDLVGSVITLAIAAGYYLAATGIRESALIGDGIGASAFPKGIATAAIGLGTILFLMSLFRLMILRREEAPVQPAAPAAEKVWMPHLRAAGMLAIGIGYLLVMPHIGWLVAIFILLIIVAWYNGHALNKDILVFAAIVTVAFFLLFVMLLQIPMPHGSLIDGFL